jgi:hypothetical protein
VHALEAGCRLVERREMGAHGEFALIRDPFDTAIALLQVVPNDGD